MTITGIGFDGRTSRGAGYRLTLISPWLVVDGRRYNDDHVWPLIDIDLLCLQQLATATGYGNWLRQLATSMSCRHEQGLLPRVC